MASSNPFPDHQTCPIPHTNEKGEVRRKKNLWLFGQLASRASPTLDNASSLGDLYLPKVARQRYAHLAYQTQIHHSDRELKHQHTRQDFKLFQLISKFLQSSLNINAQYRKASIYRHGNELYNFPDKTNSYLHVFLRLSTDV